MNRTSTTSVSITPTVKASGLIVISVLMFSVLPLFIALLGIESPFLFASTWTIGEIGVLSAIMFFGYRTLFLDKRVWKLAWIHCLSWPMLLWTVAGWDYALFAWSAGFVDVSITTVLFETWPILLIVLTSWLFRHETRYRKVSVVVYVAFVLALGGVAAVVMSQSETWNSTFDSTSSSLSFNLVLGILLALGAAVLAAMAAFGFRWAVDYAGKLPDTHYHYHSRGSLELFAVAMGILLTDIFAAPFMIAVGFARNESASFSVLSASLLIAPLVTVFAGLFWRWGNLITKHLSINAISYFRPLFSLSLLLLFGQIGDVNLTLLFVGAFLIIMANVFVFIQEHSNAQSLRVESQDISSVNDLIASGESGTVEFKSTLRVNTYTNKRDHRIESAALKTLGAFLNSDGGTLVIGVADEGRPARVGEGELTGIDIDGFPNEDRMSLYLRDIVTGRMSGIAMSYIAPTFHDFEGARIMVVRCEPSSQPIYVNEGNSEVFYVRYGAATEPLSISDSVTYITSRFQS